jgi:hypothetical protein
MFSGTRQLNGRRIGLLLAALTGVLLAAFALVLMASNNPAQAAPKIVDVSAKASGDGFDTGIHVDAGDLVVITASGQTGDGTGGTVPLGGTVNLTTDQTSCLYGVGPNGVGKSCYDPTNDAEFTASNLPAGALLYRIGTSGPWSLVGSGTSFTAQKSGELYLIVNDRDTAAGRADNSGEFKVKIDVTSPSPPTDTTRPRVISTVPAKGATGVGPNANIKANFSEDMRASTINGQTFELFKKGSGTKVGAVVSYDASRDRATLNPNNSLQRGATYKAVVTTFAKDQAGNRLDQRPGVSGLQPKQWSFTIID